MDTLVVGARGMLGCEMVRLLADRGSEVLGADIDDVDITVPSSVRRLVREHLPRVIINCAAYTSVDRAEQEPELAMAVNGHGPANLAGCAIEAGAILIHFSTDFVFDGRKTTPYRPDDEPNPLNSYGRSKLAGERAVVEAGGSYLIIRSSWLYGRHGPNFVSAVLKRAEDGAPLRVVSDQMGRPTWAANLAAVTLDLLDRRARGIFHATDGGQTTWLGLAQQVLAVRGLDVPIEGVTTGQWGAAAARPAYSALDISATEALLGRAMEPWRSALARYLTGRDS